MFAVSSFVGLVIATFGGGAEWLAAAGGLGAVALGAQQVAAAIHDAESKRRKVAALARLLHRSLVEMCVLSEKVGSMREWLEQIGNARSLDTIQDQFRELQGMAAELGGDASDSADRAFERFLRAADVINPLYARRDSLPPDADTLGERGQILERMIAAIDALILIAPPKPEEPRLPESLRSTAEGLAILAPDPDNE